jgi:hypothetical protein
MRVDCTGTDERQANLAVWALKKLTCTTPPRVSFCEKSSQSIENKRPALQKARKSSEDAENNRDNLALTENWC